MLRIFTYIRNSYIKNASTEGIYISSTYNIIGIYIILVLLST